MFDRFCFLMHWLHQGSDCQMKKLLVLPCFPDLDQRFAGNLKEVGQMEPDTAPQAQKKRFLGHFWGKSFYIENAMKIALLALKAKKNAK